MENINIFFTEYNKKKTGIELHAALLWEDDEKLEISLDGCLDTNNSGSFYDVFQKFIDEYNRATVVVLNLKKLNYISSTGIGTFVTILTSLKKNEISLFLMHISEKIYSIFELLGFNNFFVFINSPDKIKQQTPAGQPHSEGEKKQCIHCGKTLKIAKPGKYRCSACKNLIVLDVNGKLSKG